MPQDHAELAARLAWCKPEHTLFGSSFIGVALEVERMAAGHPRLPEYLARANPAGRENLFRYPLSEFLTLLHDGADLVATQTGLDPALAMSDLGLAIATRFTNSPEGAVARKLVAGKNPMDLMTAAPAVFGSRCSWGKRTFERLSATHCALHVKECPLPVGYYVGTLRNAAAQNGHRIEVDGQSLGVLECRTTVTWDGQPPSAIT
jgi:uncharacterized protein (TIGR02265 family)